MTTEEIRHRISEICTLFGFEYNGKVGDVDPFSETDFDLTYDGETIKVDSIDKVMETPFFDGKSLAEIVSEIDIIAF